MVVEEKHDEPELVIVVVQIPQLLEQVVGYRELHALGVEQQRQGLQLD
jgi:hypothetical protein